MYMSFGPINFFCFYFITTLEWIECRRRTEGVASARHSPTRKTLLLTFGFPHGSPLLTMKRNKILPRL